MTGKTQQACLLGQYDATGHIQFLAAELELEKIVSSPTVTDKELNQAADELATQKIPSAIKKARKRAAELKQFFLQTMPKAKAKIWIAAEKCVCCKGLIGDGKSFEGGILSGKSICKSCLSMLGKYCSRFPTDAAVTCAGIQISRPERRSKVPLRIPCKSKPKPGLQFCESCERELVAVMDSGLRCGYPGCTKRVIRIAELCKVTDLWSVSACYHWNPLLQRGIVWGSANPLYAGWIPLQQSAWFCLSHLREAERSLAWWEETVPCSNAMCQRRLNPLQPAKRNVQGEDGLLYCSAKCRKEVNRGVCPVCGKSKEVLVNLGGICKSCSHKIKSR